MAHEMDGLTREDADADAIHQRIAERVRDLPRRGAWREWRDLAALTAATTAAPVAAVAWATGAAPALTLGLTAVAAAAVGLAARVLRLGHGSYPAAPARGRRAELRVIPGPHRRAAALALTASPAARRAGLPGPGR